jgi:hypothetical protein
MMGTALDAQIELRPYQCEALTAIEAAALRGVRRQIISLPTGAGKTVIFCHLLVEQQTRTLILVHRDELVRQTLDKLTMVAREPRPLVCGRAALTPHRATPGPPGASAGNWGNRGRITANKERA